MFEREILILEKKNEGSLRSRRRRNKGSQKSFNFPTECTHFRGPQRLTRIIQIFIFYLLGLYWKLFMFYYIWILFWSLLFI